MKLTDYYRYQQQPLWSKIAKMKGVMPTEDIKKEDVKEESRRQEAVEESNQPSELEEQACRGIFENKYLRAHADEAAHEKRIRLAAPSCHGER